ISIKRLLLGLCAVMLLLSIAFVPSALMQQQGGPYKLSPSVIAGGGGSSTNATTRIEGTVGQAALGLSSGGAFTLNAGLWQGDAPCAAVSISSQPAGQTVCAGDSASFSVTANGSVTAYQWRKGGINLANGGNITGATSAMLTINPAGSADGSSYDV